MKRALCAAWLLMTVQTLVVAASVSNIISLRSQLLSLANEYYNLSQLKKENGYPWGRQQFVQAIDLAKEQYNASFNVVSEEGEVVDESRITDEYEAELENAITELHDARNHFDSTNWDFQELRIYMSKSQDLCIFKETQGVNASVLRQAYDEAYGVHEAVTETSDSATISTEREMVTTAKSALINTYWEFFYSSASCNTPSFLEIENADFSRNSGYPYVSWWNYECDYTEDITKEAFKRTADSNFEGGYRRGVWRGTSVAPASKLSQTIGVQRAGVYEYRAQGYAASELKSHDQAMWRIVYDSQGNAVDTIFNGNSQVKFFFGPAETEKNSVRVKSHYYGFPLAEGRETNLYMPSWYSVYYVKTDDTDEAITFGMDSFGQAALNGFGANAYGFGSNSVRYLGPYDDFVAQMRVNLQDSINQAQRVLGNSVHTQGRYRLKKVIDRAEQALSGGVLSDMGNACWDLSEAVTDVLSYVEPVSDVRNWDFTSWSTDTRNRLHNEAIGVAAPLESKSTTHHSWRAFEKYYDVDNTDHLDHCYWWGDKEVDGNGSLGINGEPIQETAGLVFETVKAGALAIAVDYFDEGQAMEEGAQYLWMGGNGMSLVIPQVKAGSVITADVASHKIANARGLDLIIGSDTIAPIQGSNLVTTRTTCVWQIPEEFGGLWAAKLINNNGCHIYNIKVEAPKPVSNIFTAETIEGVSVKYTITNEQQKTCMVGEGDSGSAIDLGTSGYVTIPATVQGYVVTWVGSRAFSGAQDITGVTLPGTISGRGCIGKESFQNCSSLESVKIYAAEAFDVDDLAFDGISNKCTLYVREGLKQQFLASKGMNHFAQVSDVLVRRPVSLCRDHTLTLSTDEPGSIIRYTTDGSNPMIDSQVYTDQLLMDDSCVVKAIADVQGNLSGVTTFIWYSQTCKSVEVTFSHTSVTMASEPGADIYYTTDDSYPTTESQHYTGSFIMPDLKNIRAVAFMEGKNPSDVTIFEVPYIFSGNTLNIKLPGFMTYALKTEEAKNLKQLRVVGDISTADVTELRTLAALQQLDLSETTLTEGMLPDGCFAGMTQLLSFSSPKTIGVVGAGLFNGCNNLAAIQWNTKGRLSDAAMQGVSNPNLLVYINTRGFAPSAFRNIVVNGRSESITLSDTYLGSNANFFCPVAFHANRISYVHRYEMTTERQVCRGWETIALPFSPTVITHETKGTIAPFADNQAGNDVSRFWLYGLDNGVGFRRASRIEANMPYIISMPNSTAYDDRYNLGGLVTFSATDVEMPVSSSTGQAQQGSLFALTPVFCAQEQDDNIFVLNIHNSNTPYNGAWQPGSTFAAGLRRVQPFEAFATLLGNNARDYMLIEEMFDDNVTAIDPIAEHRSATTTTYDLSGRLVQQEATSPLQRGIYVRQGRKVVIKR